MEGRAANYNHVFVVQVNFIYTNKLKGKRQFNIWAGRHSRLSVRELNAVTRTALLLPEHTSLKYLQYSYSVNLLKMTSF